MLLPYPPMPNYFREYDGLSSNHETKKNGTGLTLTCLMGNGTALQKMWRRRLQKSGHRVVRRSSPSSRDGFWKGGGAKDLLCTTMRIRRQQNYCRKKFLSSISNKTRLSETVWSQKKDPRCNVPPELVSNLMKHETLDVRGFVRRGPLQIQADRYKQTPGTYNLAQVCREAAFPKLVEIGKYFVNKTANFLEEMRVKNWSRIHQSSRCTQNRTERCYWSQHQNWTDSRHADYRTVWSLRYWGQNWFIGEGWVNFLGCHQQECGRLCNGAFYVRWQRYSQYKETRSVDEVSCTIKLFIL